MQFWFRAPYTMSQRHRVLLIDSHVSTCELISAFLSKEGRLLIAAEAPSISDGLNCYRQYEPDMVISELEFLEGDSLEMLKIMREEKPSLKVVIYTGSTNQTLIGDCIRLEAQGFVHKTDSLLQLSQTIAMVAQGQTCFSPYVNSVLQQRRAQSVSAASLTTKERLILQLVGKGLSSKEVAEKLSLSKKTIEHYRQTLMRKVGVHSTTALVLHAVKLGLVQLSLSAMLNTDAIDWLSPESLAEFAAYL